MTASLLAGNERDLGNMTAGGTESILMAVKTARDWCAREAAGGQHPGDVLPRRRILPSTRRHYFGVSRW